LSSTILPTACTPLSQAYFSEAVWKVGAATKYGMSFSVSPSPFARRSAATTES
jgi:hypothetical protein